MTAEEPPSEAPPEQEAASTPQVVSSQEHKKGADLLDAAKDGNIEEVKKLIADGAKHGYQDSAGWTALMWASSEGFDDCVAQLLEAGAASEYRPKAEDPDAKKTSTAPQVATNTPLHWAAYHGHSSIVWQLITHGLSPSDVDSCGNNALHLACAGGHFLVIQSILSQGPDVNVKNWYGNTALSLTTNETCRTMVKKAEVATSEGKKFLCSCSGVFVSEDESVREEVIDRISAPTLRPVRYSKECHEKIRLAEDALNHAIKTSDMEALMKAIVDAEKIGASVLLLNEATQALECMEAQIKLTESMDTVNAQRPLKDRLLAKPLLTRLVVAREKLVDPQLIAKGEQLCTTVDAEAALLDCIGQCEVLVMPASEVVPAAESPDSLRAEAGINKLNVSIATAQTAEAAADLVAQAEALHRRLIAESELRKAMVEPKVEVIEATPENPEESKKWTHSNSSVTNSLLDMLRLRVEMLDNALSTCQNEEVNQVIIDSASKDRKVWQKELTTEVAEDEERRRKEELARLKAEKKKKKKKK